MKSNYKAMVLSCIDPRFQPIVYNYLKKKKLTGKYSSFTIAGSAIGVTANKFKRWHKVFWDNFETSVKLHNIKKLIVINHRDCGAAKIINRKKDFTNLNENIRFGLSVPRIDSLLSPILLTLPLQMLAYHVALLKNCDVDKPRNLAKSVTVE